MTERIPRLETERLYIRELVREDLAQINHVLNAAFGAEDTASDFEPWLEWTALGYRMFAMLGQPHYGERGIELKATGELIGAVGIVPYIEEFGHLAAVDGRPGEASAEVGLFWAIHPDYQGKGYATEAAEAVVYYLTRYRKLARIIATTGPDNKASQAVMRKLGMVVEEVPPPAPGGIRVVGVLDNRSDWRATIHAVIRHPERPLIYLQKWRSGYGLPRAAAPMEMWQAWTDKVVATLRRRLPGPLWVYRLLHFQRDEKRRRALGVYEVSYNAPLPPGEWVDRQRLEALSLREEKLRPVLDAYLTEREAGTVPRQRPAWSQPGWRPEALAWIEREVARLGEEVTAVEQVKHWCLSSVLRVRTGGPVYYFKAPVKLALFVDEAPFLTELATRFPGYVPAPLAVDPQRGWFLLTDLGTAFDFHTPPETRQHILRRFGQLQRMSVRHIDALLAAGCGDRRLVVLAEQIEPLLADETAVAALTSDERARLRAQIPRLKSLCRRLATYAVPETLLHGDLHVGNAARLGGQIVFFDWTDACIAHPFFDLLSLRWEVNPFEREAVRTAYMEAWSEFESPERLAEAAALADVLRPLHHAVSLQHINAGVEPLAAKAMMGPGAYLRELLGVVEGSEE